MCSLSQKAENGSTATGEETCCRDKDQDHSQPEADEMVGPPSPAQPKEAEARGELKNSDVKNQGSMECGHNDIDERTDPEHDGQARDDLE